MIDILLNNKQYFLHPFSEGSYGFQLHGFNKTNNLLYYLKDGYAVNIKLEHDQNIIIGKISDIINDNNICVTLVERHVYDNKLIMYKDYMYNYDNEELYDIDFPKDSFKTF